MKFDDFAIVRVKDIQPQAFFNLIEKNRQHLKKGFPYTILKCATPDTAKLLVKEYIQQEESKELYTFYLKNIKSNKLIGHINVKNINISVSKCELGYFVDKEYEGIGITSKGVSEIISFCFSELHMNKIFVCAARENIGSQQVALKNGFQQEGILRKEFKNPEGELHDIVYFGLLKSDYKK